MNTQRRKIDSSGRTFMPMNMDINDTDEFMSLPKIVVLFGIIFSYVIWVLWGRSVDLNILGWIFTFIALTFINQLLLRYIIFQERYYYSIWKRDSKFGDPKASIFWNISSYRRTGMGDIMIYADMKLGCFLELEKDTIIGREQDSMEKHFDAWSEFYKHMHLLDYKYVQLNIMEPAGKDVRLDELADIASNAVNEGVRTVLEYSTGYMKEISRATLNEKDYILIYTNKTTKMNSIINDVQEISSHLLDGAYASVRIMTANEIYQIPKELWNVGYFDGIEAQMDVYRHSGRSIKNPFTLTQLIKEDNTVIKLTPADERKIVKASKLMDNNQIRLDDWNIDSILSGDFEVYQKSIVSDSKSIQEGAEAARTANQERIKSKPKKEKAVKAAKTKPVKEKAAKPVKKVKTKSAAPSFDDIESDDLGMEEDVFASNNGDSDVFEEAPVVEKKPVVKNQKAVAKKPVVKKSVVKEKKTGLFGKKQDDGFDLSAVDLSEIDSDDEYESGTEDDDIDDNTLF